MRKYLVLMGSLLTAMVVLMVVDYLKDRTVPTVTLNVASWHRGPTPVAEPFVGEWIDGGKLTVYNAIQYGTQYWEYAPTLLPPIGMLLGPVPPHWWYEMPGVAE